VPSSTRATVRRAFAPGRTEPRVAETRLPRFSHAIPRCAGVPEQSDPQPRDSVLEPEVPGAGTITLVAAVDTSAAGVGWRGSERSVGEGPTTPVAPSKGRGGPPPTWALTRGSQPPSEKRSGASTDPTAIIRGSTTNRRPT
jgi:hypothetical protein